MKSHKKEYQYDTVTEAIAALRNRGYTLDFNLEKDQLTSAEKKVNLKTEHFHIDEFHRFEGNSNPADMDIVYAISSKEGHKGILMAAFGTYADAASAEMLEKLKVKVGLKTEVNFLILGLLFGLKYGRYTMETAI